MIPKQPESRGLRQDIQETSWDNKRVRYVTGQLIVKFKAPETSERSSAKSMSDAIAAEVPGGRVKRYPRPTGRALIAFDPKENVLEVAKRLAERNDIEYVEPNMLDSAQIVPSDTRYGEQWSHPVVDSEDAWDLQTGGPAC